MSMDWVKMFGRPRFVLLFRFRERVMRRDGDTYYNLISRTEMHQLKDPFWLRSKCSEQEASIDRTPFDSHLREVHLE